MCLCIDIHIVNVILVVGYVWKLYGTPKFNRAMDCTDHALEEFRVKHFLVAFVDFRVGMFALCINSEDYCIPETFGSNLISSTIPRLSTRSFKWQEINVGCF